jgi:hypothetical protein
MHPLLFALIPFAVVIPVLLLWHLQRKRSRMRSPGTEKLLRSAGESLSRQLDEEMENVMLLLVAMCFLPPFCAITIFNSPAHSSTALVWGIILLLFYVPGLWWLWRKMTHLANLRLGLMGERAVGEELNQLMLDGFRVFHDFPSGDDWNIDHVLVGSQGVYVVETKARRKGRAETGKQDHVIIYNGKTLEFPHCTDTHGLDQARRNAQWLSNFLKSATGEPVKVKAILTFPGWYVETRCKDNHLRVLNPKQIQPAITKADPPNQLSPEKIQRIVHQLEQKCRDLEW